MIAQLACGQRTNSEEKEGRHTVGHKVFPALHAEIRSDACDGGGEDKQEHMVDGVTDVQQKLCGPVMHPESSAKCRRFGREDVQAGLSGNAGCRAIGSGLDILLKALVKIGIADEIGKTRSEEHTSELQQLMRTS